MQGSLFVIPQNVQNWCRLDVVQAALGSLDMLGSLIEQGPNYRAYRVGASFARHIVYAGCSPHLRFAPSDADDLNFCHVALHGPFDACVLQTGKNTGKPRCPACRHRWPDWSERLHQGVSACDRCGAEWNAFELDWRQQAASGRVLLEVRNVFPGEASPSDALLNALQTASGFAWRFAWAGMRVVTVSPEPLAQSENRPAYQASVPDRLG